MMVDEEIEKNQGTEREKKESKTDIQSFFA